MSIDKLYAMHGKCSVIDCAKVEAGSGSPSPEWITEFSGQHKVIF